MAVLEHIRDCSRKGERRRREIPAAVVRSAAAFGASCSPQIQDTNALMSSTASSRLKPGVAEMSSRSLRTMQEVSRTSLLLLGTSTKMTGSFRGGGAQRSLNHVRGVTGFGSRYCTTLAVRRVALPRSALAIHVDDDHISTFSRATRRGLIRWSVRHRARRWARASSDM